MSGHRAVLLHIHVVRRSGLCPFEAIPPAWEGHSASSFKPCSGLATPVNNCRKENTMFKHVGYVASLFIEADQVQYRLERHVPARRRPGGVAVRVVSRFGAVELGLYAAD